MDEPVSRRSALRFLAFGALAVGGIGIEAVRLAYLQLMQGNQTDPSPTSPTTDAIAAIRGLIYDRSGRMLVSNEPGWAVKILPADLPFPQRDQVLATLSGLLGIPVAEMRMLLDSHAGPTSDLVEIANGVREETARFIAEQQANLPGVHAVVEPRRRYLKGPLFAQVLGYTGPIDNAELADLSPHGYQASDRIGKSGVEATYETELRGTYGTETVQRDAAGSPIVTIKSTPPVAGYSLRLTIDTREQELAQQALEWGIKTAHLIAGAFIVMNPQTGEVLALVSLPTYDNNQFAAGITSAQYDHLLSTPGRPLLNHAISEQYQPGSTYKVVAGTGALADGKITPTTLIETAPYLTIGSYRYPDWNHAGFGAIDIYHGFGHSSDTFFYQLAGMLGIDRLGYWAHQYGFGSVTGIDLPAEVPGTVPTNKWKYDTLGEPIYPGEVYYAGIGEGYDDVTPIQLLNAYCAMANGGRLYQPQVVRDVLGPDRTVVRPFKAKLLHKLNIHPDVFRVMREAARTVVTIRHTYNLVDMPIKIAGKTGTAEFGIRDAQGRLPFHDWGVFFVPKDPYHGSFENPDSELAVLAFANDARTIGNTSTEIAKYYFQLHFGIKEDYRLPQLLQQGNFYGG